MATGQVCCRSSLGALRHLTGLPRALQLNPLPWGLSPSAQGPAPGDAPRSLGGRRRSPHHHLSGCLLKRSVPTPGREHCHLEDSGTQVTNVEPALI